MSKHIAILAATSALGLIATPAMAQVADRYADVAGAVDAGDAFEADWQDEAAAGAGYTDARGAVVREYYSDPVIADTGAYTPDYTYESDYDADYGPGYGDHRGRPHHPHAAAPRYAYTAAQRDEWLSQCRALHRQDDLRYYEDDDDSDGGLLGGLLGAIAGGVVGNRVADGERLAGTLIGAGLGGLAGAVIGSALDGDDDDDRYYAEDEYGFDYCEAYLLNYERGYGVPGQMAYAPVAMVPVVQQPMAHPPQHRMISRVIEIEEEVEVERRAPAPRRQIRRSVPAPQGKLQPVK